MKFCCDQETDCDASISSYYFIINWTYEICMSIAMLCEYDVYE